MISRKKCNGLTKFNSELNKLTENIPLGMIARLALQRGGYYLKPDLTIARESDYQDYYVIARDYAKKLMTLKDRELPSDFKQIFMNQCKFLTPTNSEILFEVPFAIGEGDVGWNIGIRVDGGNHSYGSGSNYMAMPPTYAYSFDQSDKRFPVTCGLYTIDSDFIQQLVSTGNMNISQGKWSPAIFWKIHREEQPRREQALTGQCFVMPM